MCIRDSLYTYSANNPTTFTDPTGQAVFFENATLDAFAVASVVALAASTVLLPAYYSRCVQVGCTPNFDFGLPSSPSFADPEAEARVENPITGAPATGNGPAPDITVEEAIGAFVATTLTAAEVITRVETARPECGQLYFHYSSTFEAGSIVLSGSLIASEPFVARATTFRAGAYATTISPLPTMTQQQLADHIRPGKDVSAFVALCSNRNQRFQAGGFPAEFSDFRVADARAGDRVPIDIEFVGPNLMP